MRARVARVPYSAALRALTSAAQALQDAGNLIGFKVPGLDPLLGTAGGAP